MAGVEVMEQITPDQIEAMSGGDYLKTEARQHENFFFYTLLKFNQYFTILGWLLQSDQKYKKIFYKTERIIIR